jgi:3-oxoacyl-[acyl-carrier protein] reductase
MELLDLGRWPGIADRPVLVTGASRGIGRSIAQALGQQGGIIVGTATTEAGAQAIGANFTDLGIKGRGAVLDIADDSSVTGLLKDMAGADGAPHILNTIAGITADNLIIIMKNDEWDSVINTNLTSLFRLAKACLRGMMKVRRGRIINIGSVVGSMGNPGQSNYAAAKAGLLGFTKALAREVGSRNITVNAVAPGFIDTDMTGNLSEEQRQALLDQIPLGRLGSGADIAAAVVFLSSDAGAYITGETLHVNGGMLMS